MNTQSTIDRLKTITQLKVVSGAAEFGALNDSLPAWPAAYVIESTFTPSDNLTVGRVSQSVDTVITVAIAVGTATDSTGAGSNQALETIRDLIRAKLLGWAPFVSASGYVATPGKLLGYRPGLLWWADGYSTTHQIGS